MLTSDTRAGTVLLLTGAVIISFSAVFVRVAAVGPATAGFYRMAFGALVLLPVALARRERLWAGAGPLGWAALAGVFFAADLACWHQGIHYLGPGLATILANFQVFFLAAAGILVFGERPSWRFFAAVPLAVAGLFLLVGAEGRDLPPTYRAGLALGFATALAYAAYTLTLRHSQRPGVGRLEPTANLLWLSLVTATLLGVGARLGGERLTIPDARSWAVLLAYGALCQALGWLLISRGVARVPTSRVGLLLLVQPTLTFLWDILFFGRPASGVELVGAGLTLAAIYLGTTRPAPLPRALAP